MSLTHGQIWRAIDALAGRHGGSASALARLAGLDPTTFNPSKRYGPDPERRPRWPSTESLARVLEVTGTPLGAFAALAGDEAPDQAVGLPLLGFAQAGAQGFFDDAGFPVGQGWDRIETPADLARGDGVYALEVAGDSMLPVYRPGDRLVVRPIQEPRRGDRLVLRLASGEVTAKELARVTPRQLELKAFNPDYPARLVARGEVVWMARILWVSQ